MVENDSIGFNPSSNFETLAKLSLFNAATSQELRVKSSFSITAAIFKHRTQDDTDGNVDADRCRRRRCRRRRRRRHRQRRERRFLTRRRSTDAKNASVEPTCLS